MRLFFYFFHSLCLVLFIPLTALATDCSSEILLTEAMINPAALSDNEGEWLELFNQSSNQLNLKGFALSSGQATFIFAEDFLINPNASVVVCKNKKALQTINIPCSFEYEKLSLVNSGGQVALSWENKACSQLNYSGSQIKDGASLEFSFTSGLWNASTTPLGELEFGTPEKFSNSTESTAPIPTPTPSTTPSNTQEPTSSNFINQDPITLSSIVPEPSSQEQAPISLLLQAILPNPTGSDSPEQEFIAIFNPNDFAVDLLDWKLSNQSKDEFIFPDNLTVSPQKTLKLFASFFNFSLKNSTETILLTNPNEQVIDSLAFNESAPENKALLKDLNGQLLWLNSNCLDGSCPPDSLSTQETILVSDPFLELIIPQDLSSKKNNPENNYESLKKEPNLTLATLIGTVSSVESEFNQNGFYLEMKNGSLLVKTAYLHSFKEKDRLVVSGTLYKNSDRLFLKSDKESQAQIIGQKTPTKHSLDKCLNQKNCSPQIPSLVEFSGTISYAKSGRFLIQGKDRTEISLELPKWMDQDLIALQKGAIVKITGILEKDSLKTKKIIVNNFKILEMAESTQSPSPTVLAKKQNQPINTPSKKTTPTHPSFLLKTPAFSEPVFLLQNPPSQKASSQSTSSTLRQFFTQFLTSVFNF